MLCDVMIYLHCRYASRCILIKFSDPPLSFTFSDYTVINELSKCSSSSIRFCISLGEKFVTEGITEVDDTIIPLLKGLIGPTANVSPRVIPSYAILYWFASKVMHSYNVMLIDIVEYCQLLSEM